MAFTSVQICANALIRLGAQPIQSFDEGTDIATTCETIYEMKRDYILSSYPWSFTMKFAQLSRLTATPTAQWDYQFALPADRLSSGIVAVFTSEDTSALPIQAYNLVGNKLLSNETELWVKYQADTDETLWPAHFFELMTFVIMDELCINVTDNVGLKQTIQANTYGIPSEYGMGGLYGRAMSLDSRDYPTLQMSSDALLAARFGRGGL